MNRGDTMAEEIKKEAAAEEETAEAEKVEEKTEA